jgi:hypothetical protein
MESSSPARSRDDCCGQAVAKADAVMGTRRGWFPFRTQHPLGAVVNPALGVV